MAPFGAKKVHMYGLQVLQPAKWMEPAIAINLALKRPLNQLVMRW